MAVSAVKKIQVTGLTRDAEAIFDTIQTLGVAHPVPPEKDAEGTAVDNDHVYKKAQVDFALSLLAPFDEEKLPLAEKLAGGRISVQLKDAEDLLDKTKLEDIERRLEDLEEKRNKIKSDIASFSSNREILTPWKHLQSAPGALETKKTRGFLLEMTLENHDLLIKRAHELKGKVHLSTVEHDDKSRILAVVRKDAESEFFPLEGIVATEVSLPVTDVRPQDALARMDTREKEIVKEEADIENQLKKLAKEHLRTLRILHDILAWKVAQVESLHSAKETTEKAFAVKLWVQEHHVSVVQNAVEKVTKHIEISNATIEEDDIIPVPLKNNRLVTPFESVTGIYGAPKYNEPDPTPFLAPFFFVFFGMCLSDAMYGIILMALSAAAIKLMKIPREGQKLFRLLILGGFSTFVFGVLFGGWFGISLESLPSAIGEPLMAVQILNPVKDPITLLIVTLVMGIIQIMVGIAVDLWWKAKNGKLKDGLLDSGTWLFFLTALMLWILAGSILKNDAFAQVALYLIYAGLILLIATQGREGKNIVMKLVKGVGSLYGLVGFFSDTLSYSRLLALGLATGIIASVVNLVAILFRDMIPLVGWVVFFLVLIGGHTFNIVINVLGAYIHSGRLQFVEFFPKFMEGGGKRFSPLKRQMKYIRINE